MEPDNHLVWYVAYGSNLASARLRCYLIGGRPDGARRTYPGARNRSAPLRSRPVELPGAIHFSGHSLAWSGAIAFYDPLVDGLVAARAFLLEMDQVNDLVAQEIRHPPGIDLDLLAGREHGSRRLGGRAYDTALRLGDFEGHPSVTITSSQAREPAMPSTAYLRWICQGLHEAFGWTPERTADYLGQASGVRDNWTCDDLLELAAGAGPA